MPPTGNTDSAPALLNAAIEAAREAGAMLREEFHAPAGRRGQQQSAAIDAEVEALLKRRLLDALPCGWLGEETGRQEMDSRSIWVVDPHDGTGAFLQGRRGSSVSIALIQDCRPVLGVVYAFSYPDDIGDLIAWAEGSGPLTRNGRPIKSELADKRLEAGEIVALSYVASQLPDVNGRLVAPARFLSLPSIAYRLALAASGDAVAAVALNPLRSWDFAAGHALLRGVGGTLLDQDGAEVIYDQAGAARTSRCFGGAPSAVRELASRNWSLAMVEDPGDPRDASPLRRQRDPLRLNRAQGCLLGQVAGDALGALVEFESKARINSRYPGGLRQLADGGPWNISAGQPTDDSELAITLARSLVRERGFDKEKVKLSYQGWLASSPFDVGHTTRTGLTGQRNHQSRANGSLMRTSPIGIFAAGDPARAAWIAHRDSAITHNNAVCVLACAAFAASISVGVAGGTRDEMFRAALEFSETKEADIWIVRKVLQAAQDGAPDDYETNMGWVLLALHNAYFHLLAGSSVDEAIIATAAQGGDTDTNAAIVGALLGAADGRDAVPDTWRLSVLSCRADRALGASQPRPREYWADDLFELAEGLLDAGSAA